MNADSSPRSLSLDGPVIEGSPKLSPATAGSHAQLSRFLYVLLVTVGANTLIAGLVTLFLSNSFLPNLRIAHTIGISIFLFSWVLRRLALRASWKISLIAVLAGTVFGVGVGGIWEWWALGRLMIGSPRLLMATLAIAITFGAVLSYYFHSRVALAKDAQRCTEAELKLLQAQIEPHFLFNTLSVILRLIDANPQGAKRMLFNLTSYLRGVLRRTRAGATTLGEEIDLVRAYLDIQAVRMGERLSYVVECPPALLGLALPPLLLQPLVENAIRHGLEPSPIGGEVRVLAAREGQTLVLEVQDTGMGLSNGSGAGVGLSNVSARVAAISQGSGSMVIHPNVPRGLRVRVELPYSDTFA